MSRPIKMTEEFMDGFIETVKSELQGTRLSQGKIDLKVPLEWKTPYKARIEFTPEAFVKMYDLIDHQDQEVGWHGICKRDAENEGLFVISDILVYPQVVTGSTVTPDQKLYEDWLKGMDDDTFFGTRFQGHSHVNMGVTPSGVDEAFYESILKGLEDNDFYVFMVLNKKLECYARIYDMKNNILYETADITMGVQGDIPVAMWQQVFKMAHIFKAFSFKDIRKMMEQFVSFDLVTFSKEVSANVAKHTYTAGNFGGSNYQSGNYGRNGSNRLEGD
jgi:hypothetical protein